MNDEIKNAIADFLDSVGRLKSLGVFRSDKYLGDLGEYICKHFYEIELATSGRQPGHDGIGTDGLVQIKYHGSITKTNVDLGNPDEYEILLIVLGPQSLLRNTLHRDDFLIYRLSADEVRKHKNSGRKTYSCGKKPFIKEPDQALNITKTLCNNF